MKKNTKGSDRDLGKIGRYFIAKDNIYMLYMLYELYECYISLQTTD